MASPCVPLFAAVAPAGRPVAELERRLRVHFQFRCAAGRTCVVRPHDPSRGLYRLHFDAEDVRQRVLSQKVHKLNVAEEGRLVLTVTLHERADDPEVGLSTEEKVPEQVPEEDHLETRDGMVKILQEYVENATKEEEGAKQTIEETVSVAPGNYAVLHHVLIEENIYNKNPDVKLSYDSSAKILQLHGINTEVYKMKCILLEKLYKMEEKHVYVHPSIFQFLQRANNNQVSMNIFGANKINASYELAPDCVILVGCSPEVVWKAEELMKKDLDHKQITVEDQGILKKKEWKGIVRVFERENNSSEVDVIMDDRLVSGKVTIAGYTKTVAEVYCLLSEFVERNTHMIKEISAKCVAVVKFVEQEKSEVWLSLRKKGVKIEFGPKAKSKSIILSGSKAEVPAAAEEVEQLLSSVHSLTVVIVKPGVKSFFRSQEHSYITEAKQTFGCLIRLRKDEESTEGSKEKTGHPHSEITSDKTLQALPDALSEPCRDGSPQPRQPVPQSDKQPTAIGEDLPVVFSFFGLKSLLVEKGIEEAMTDVIVSGIGSDLKLGVGPLSRALLKKAGPQLQAEFDQVVQQGQQAQVGSVIQTSGCSLPCKFVLHAVVPPWNAGKGNEMKVLRDIVKDCLEKTEALSLNSISFPAIGTGGFGFPKAEVAKLMFEEVLRFSFKKKPKSLQEVHFVLHPGDGNNIKTFYEVFESRIGRSLKRASPNDGQSAGLSGPISTPVWGIHEMQIGMIKLQVATGDITKENADVIVNITNASFNAKSGVSKAILEGAGPQVEDECALLALQANNGFITTQAGNLICKNIIHLISDSDIKAQVSKVLQECELKKYTSVAFPAIGTGQGGKSPENAADEIISAIADFAGKKSPQNLKVIKIVIFQPHILNAFYACMKNKEGSELPSSGSFFSTLKNFVTAKIWPTPKKHLLVLEKKSEVAVFEICGEHKKNVEDTNSWLKQLILQEQTEKHIRDMLIEMFDEAEIKQLNDLQERLHVAIHLDRKQSPPSITVSGIPRDVLEAITEIQKLIQRMKDDQEEEFKAKLAQNLVEWQYAVKEDVFVPFDLLDNLHLEDAKADNTEKVEVYIQGKSCMANVKNMTAIVSNGRSISIRRMVKEEGKLLIGLPKHWEDMKGVSVKQVSLQPATPEYQDVEKKFRATCPTQKIEEIERIQNSDLWLSYRVKKEAMDNKNGHGNNEKLLFHGTPRSTLTPINHNGFNRSYAGKNAAMIGNGTYFAMNASYSAQDTYSTPDANGRKYMYLARVLTGEFTLGHPSYLTPPPKTPGGADLYDSVTDNLENPSMFVVFHDAQAYPEYLITFRN